MSYLVFLNFLPYFFQISYFFDTEIMFIWQLLRSGGCFYLFVNIKEKERKKQHTVSDCLFSTLALKWTDRTASHNARLQNWNVFQVPLSKLRSSWKKIWTNNRISSGRNHKVRNKISTNINYLLFLEQKKM